MENNENDGGVTEQELCADTVGVEEVPIGVEEVPVEVEDKSVGQAEGVDEVAYSGDAAVLQPASDIEEDETEDLGTLGDKLIDTVSVEANVESMCHRTKMPEAVAKYIMGIVYIALGIVCTAIPHQIETVLPYIVGSILGVFAIMRFIFAMIDKEYVQTYSNKTASSIIMLGVSIMIIIEHEWAHSFIPTVWGVWGLFEGAHAFNHAISRIAKHKRFFFYLVKGITEVVVAFLLLYEPQQYGELHIIVFGVSLILDGLVTIPFIHRFVTRR